MFLYRSRWNTNKNVRGSWTYYKMEEPTDDEVFIEHLAEPIGEPKPVSKVFVNASCMKKVYLYTTGQNCGTTCFSMIA